MAVAWTAMRLRHYTCMCAVSREDSMGPIQNFFFLFD
jgi:hypothetical protein